MAWDRKRQSGQPVLKPWNWVRATDSARHSGASSRRATLVQTHWGTTACCWTCAIWGEKKIDERLPLVRDLCISYLEPRTRSWPIPIRLVVHYMMGGIHTDVQAATRLPGLFAAGECACVSINGANRLGSNSLTELLVFGRRAALSGPICNPIRPPSSDAALAAKGEKSQKPHQALFDKSDGTETIAGLRRGNDGHHGSERRYHRTGEGLAAACEKIAELRRRPPTSR